MGTTKSTADKTRAAVGTARHGPNQKNVRSTANRKGKGMPSAPTGPLKGPDKGRG